MRKPLRVSQTEAPDRSAPTRGGDNALSRGRDAAPDGRLPPISAWIRCSAMQPEGTFAVAHAIARLAANIGIESLAQTASDQAQGFDLGRATVVGIGQDPGQFGQRFGHPPFRCRKSRVSCPRTGNPGNACVISARHVSHRGKPKWNPSAHCKPEAALADGWSRTWPTSSFLNP